eukprot:11085792-Prorocentrum_lima.AAC.1
MTSSLVGSEMCIRDSMKTYGGIAVWNARWLRDPGTIRNRAKCASYWEGAVSYTHLTLPTICSV